MSKINIEKENVQKAYHTGCSDVKKALKHLFPDIFKKIKIDLSRLRLEHREASSESTILKWDQDNKNSQKAGLTEGFILEFTSKGISLDLDYNWELKGEFLIPTNKVG